MSVPLLTGAQCRLSHLLLKQPEQAASHPPLQKGAESRELKLELELGRLLLKTLRRWKEEKLTVLLE